MLCNNKKPHANLSNVVGSGNGTDVRNYVLTHTHTRTAIYFTLGKASRLGV